MTTYITVDRETYPGVIVVHAERRHYLDATDVQKFGEELWVLVEDTTNPKIILSLKNTVFLSSAALNRITIFDKKCKAAGGRWALCDVHSDIEHVLAITRLNQLFNITPDVFTAVQQLTVPVPI